MRLEQRDSYQRTFSGEVTQVIREESRAWVVLDRSLFYPTSGGQPHDTGTLGEGRVVDVVKEGKEVRHLVQGHLEVGQRVDGEIDWNRRYRHMQRHTGQHLLSQAFIRVHPTFETKSVSLTSPICTLDFVGEPDEVAQLEAETLVNVVVYKNLEVDAFEVDEEEVKDYPLRRPPKVRGRIRIVKMGDWEVSACGGTHLRRTAEAGPIKLLRSERTKGGLTRVYFVCGLEALQDYELKHSVSRTLALGFSTRVEQLPERVSALQSDLAEKAREVNELHAKLAALLSEKLLANAPQGQRGRVVKHQLAADEAALLKPLAASLTEQEDVVALLGVVQNGRAQLLFARGSALTLDMADLIREVLPVVNGRGGGKPELAQGSGSEPERLEEALEHAANLL